MPTIFRIVDIETIGHENADEWLGPVKPDARLKDPEKIAASIAEKTADRKSALDPDCCRIVALGWADDGGGDPVCDLARDEQDEAEMLRRFWALYTPLVRLVSFYGFKFDLPVLKRRSLYLGVKHPTCSVDRYKTRHIDVHFELTERGQLREAHSLAFYGKRLGIGTLDKVDGADVGALVKADQWEAVREHCLSDVGITHALALRFGMLV